jgi:hypothetical protein
MKNSVVTKIDQDSKGLSKTNEQNDFDEWWWDFMWMNDWCIWVFKGFVN